MDDLLAFRVAFLGPFCSCQRYEWNTYLLFPPYIDTYMYLYIYIYMLVHLCSTAFLSSMPWGYPIVGISTPELSLILGPAISSPTSSRNPWMMVSRRGIIPFYGLQVSELLYLTQIYPFSDAGKGLFDFCSYKEGLCNLHAEKWSRGSGLLAVESSVLFCVSKT